MNLKKLFVAAATLALLALPAAAQAPEKPKIVIGVGGKALLYYLPLTVAETKGYFKEAGLEVEITDFGGGARALQSLLGGSADVVTGAYEHTIRMQTKGQDVRAVLELGRFPGIVLAVKKEKAGQIKSAADLKGMKIGVTAPGSSTNFFVNYLMAKAGAKYQDASFIGVGTGLGAVASIKKGEIDAISNLDPVISKLETDGDVVVIADSRTEAGTKAIFGGANPAAVVYMKNEFIEKNPNTTQAIVNAHYKALKWIVSSSPEEIAKAVPEAYYLGDKDLYIKAVKASLDTYSRTGIIPLDGMKSALGMLKEFDAELKNVKDEDLPKTFVDRFVKKAAGG
ncbi:MAG: transporter substrate-binding domain-containing protein [Alphaproteobacteria bacterium]|nr:transporter substrate-binding domain-containing protein [Alphaproteobacteria bacterium]